ncbi:hypothetical protein AVEN_82270-1 [Araneus ventricosus]|uniref:Uncharacterized protein n=1 Tax=Araneus ventricosus TaxID=182803 RepID=A0A4Y2HDS7_ARAVE|nr:hypothetical protein AVEN_82270-1 [Araneus ventricosus]
MQSDSSPQELVQPRIWLQSRGKKTPVFSKFRSPKQHHGVALSVFTSQLSLSLARLLLFSLSPFLNLFPQRPGEWRMNYFTTIRQPAGQTTQPQSCTFLPGYHWQRSTLNCPSLSAPLMGSTQTVPQSLFPEHLWVCQHGSCIGTDLIILNQGRMTGTAPQPALASAMCRRGVGLAPADLACARPAYTADLRWNQVSSRESSSSKAET